MRISFKLLARVCRRIISTVVMAGVSDTSRRISECPIRRQSPTLRLLRRVIVCLRAATQSVRSDASNEQLAGRRVTLRYVAAREHLNT